MAHFAEIDENNIVLRVIVVDNEKCLDENGEESEEIGAFFCHQLLGGRWVQTSYSGRVRGKYAGVGDFYNNIQDLFIDLNIDIISESIDYGTIVGEGNDGY